MLTKAWGLLLRLRLRLCTYVSRTGSNNFVKGFFQKRRHVGCGRVVVVVVVWVSPLMYFFPPFHRRCDRT